MNFGTDEESLGDVVKMILGLQGDVILSARTSIVERCMEDQEGVRAFHRAARRGEREPHDGPKQKAEQVVRPAPTKEVLDSMSSIKPKHPQSLVTEQANQGSKRKATESEGDGLGPEPDQSRSS